MTAPDLRFALRPDGLHRACILCGADFRITPAVDVLRGPSTVRHAHGSGAAGRIAEVVFAEAKAWAEYERGLASAWAQCYNSGGESGA